MKHNRPTLSVKEKIRLIVRVENGASYASVACSSGTHKNQLIKWNKLYLQDCIRGLQSLKRCKENCMDNSLMENFFGIMKNEMFYGEEATFKTLDELQAAMKDYIRYYNEERINTKRKRFNTFTI